MGFLSKGVGFCKKIGVGMWEKLAGAPNAAAVFADASSDKKKKALEQAACIIAVDFTKGNERTGQVSFQGKSLHLIREGIQNPYQHVMTVLGTVFKFLLNKPIDCYGFGDAKTSDDQVFNFSPQNNPCSGIKEAIAQYVKIAPGLYLADTLSFAPIINMAISTVKKNKGKEHVLVIISNGPVHRDEDTERGQLSCQEKKTVDAIENARKCSLSIILIGVGDKSGDLIRFFQDNISTQASEIFQVVNYTEIMAQGVPESTKEMLFALEFMKKLRCS